MEIPRPINSVLIRFNFSLLSNICILLMFILNRSTDFALGCNHFVNKSGGFGLLVRTNCLSSRSRTVICF